MGIVERRGKAREGNHGGGKQKEWQILFGEMERVWEGSAVRDCRIHNMQIRERTAVCRTNGEEDGRGHLRVMKKRRPDHSADSPR